MSKEEIQPTIDIVTTLLKELQECNTERRRSSISTELKLANKIRNITIATAKSKYLSDLANKIGKLSGSNCKTAWKAVRQCKLGNKNNHIKQKTISLRMETGK